MGCPVPPSVRRVVGGGGLGHLQGVGANRSPPDSCRNVCLPQTGKGWWLALTLASVVWLFVSPAAALVAASVVAAADVWWLQTIGWLILIYRVQAGSTTYTLTPEALVRTRQWVWPWARNITRMELDSVTRVQVESGEGEEEHCKVRAPGVTFSLTTVDREFAVVLGQALRNLYKENVVDGDRECVHLGLTGSPPRTRPADPTDAAPDAPQDPATPPTQDRPTDRPR